MDSMQLIHSAAALLWEKELPASGKSIFCKQKSSNTGITLQNPWIQPTRSLKYQFVQKDGEKDMFSTNKACHHFFGKHSHVPVGPKFTYLIYLCKLGSKKAEV